MSSRYVLYILGYPYDTMILNKELLKFAFWLILKIILSTDYILKLGYMKEELLVIVCHNKTVNFFWFVYRLPVKRLELIMMEFTGIITWI
jgi:hypothetical protein